MSSLPQGATAFPTPLYPHLRSPEFRDVYEPAEDTFLLLDALEKEQCFLDKLRPAMCVEVGSGSGVVLTFLAALLSAPSFFWAVDRNAAACSCTRKTMEINGFSSCSDVLVMDLMTCFKQRLDRSVDVLVFNPPYVVTPSEEVGGCGISASWAGGVDGREVIDVFLRSTVDLMSPSGVLYMVMIRENKPDEVCDMMSTRGFQSEEVLSRVARNEALSVIKFFR